MSYIKCYLKKKTLLGISPTQSEFQVLFTEPRFEMTPIGDKTLKTDIF